MGTASSTDAARGVSICPQRYTIGDRTPGLVRGSDGSLSISIARDLPGDTRNVNWLPAPKARPFILILRTYLPRRELITRTYVPPSVDLVQ